MRATPEAHSFAITVNQGDIIMTIMHELEAWRTTRFHAAGATLLGELPEDNFAAVTAECTSCKSQFETNWSDADTAARNQVLLCPQEHDVPVRLDGGVTVKASMTKAARDRQFVLSSLEEYGELTLLDLTELFANTFDSAVYQRLRLQVLAMATESEVLIESRHVRERKAVEKVTEEQIITDSTDERGRRILVLRQVRETVQERKRGRQQLHVRLP